MAFKFIILSTLLVAASAGYIPTANHHYATPTYVTKVANPSEDAVAQTQQNVVRSFDGTVSQYSKSIHTPYSSVHKEDTRISNNVYTPQKSVSFAAPAVTKTVTYAAPAVTKTIYHAPEIHEEQPDHVYAAPAPTAAVYTQSAADNAVYTHATPAYTHPAPTAAVYTHSAPSMYTHSAPNVALYHQEAAHAGTTYSHNHDHATYQQQEAPSSGTTTTTYNHGPAASTYSHNGHGVSAYGSSQTVRYSPAHMVSHMSFDGFGTHWGY
ncbi:larval/pupal cuticle protein H1C-like [Stomoxys calcitrans]|uniref:larval/pupal cuticle protein H1C-like n=1 Tax=Stomoxys calcitrans TaxID=35570 RepID=UPI0027E22171|nr:larval/pupal cuticle protein H1C-like [Stomoxys calcitrans]